MRIGKWVVVVGIARRTKRRSVDELAASAATAKQRRAVTAFILEMVAAVHRPVSDFACARRKTFAASSAD